MSTDTYIINSPIKRIKSVFFLAISVFIMGCNNPLLKNGPDKVMLQYLDALNSGRFKESYLLLSNEDRTVKLINDYVNEKEKERETEVAKIIASNTKYSVVDTLVIDNSAACEVKFIRPDVEKVMGEIIGAAFKSAFSKEKTPSPEKILSEKFRDGELPTKIERVNFNLIQENGNWRLYLDLKSRKNREIERQKKEALLDEANKLKSSGNLVAAKGKYNEVLKLDSKEVRASRGLDSVSEEEIKLANKRALLEEKQAYVDKVILSDLEGSYHKTYLKDRVAGVNFKLRNTGNRTLKEVEVTVYFLDANQKVIFEEDYHPVLVTKFSFGDDKPLKPGYIWQMEEGKFYKAEKVPDEWEEGFVTGKITNIEFE